MKNCLTVIGARQHNLANLSCELPRDQLVVLTGPSGSGKSSLAFDTLFAESQRRYVESLSAYARQFLDQLPRPDVDSIEGLSPAIAVSQDSAPASPRSTVGTATEIADYLRLLFARCGVPHCPVGGEPLRAFSAQQIVDEVLERPPGTKVVLLAGVLREHAGSVEEEIDHLRRQGFVRAQLNGLAFELSDGAPATALKNGTQPQNLDVVIDRIVVKDGLRSRLTDSVELALRVGKGRLLLQYPESGETLQRSEHFSCAIHGTELPLLQPRLFSFNSPVGACPGCHGLGVQARFSPDLIVPDPTRTLRQGALVSFGSPGSVNFSVLLNQVVKALAVDPDTAWERLEPALQHWILFGRDATERPSKGTGKGKAKAKAANYPGVIPALEQRLQAHDGVGTDTQAEAEDEGAYPSADLSRLQASSTCSVCLGLRLNQAALSVLVSGKNFAQLCALSLIEFQAWVQSELLVNVASEKREIALPLLRALSSRVGFLTQVGLGYLSLDRRATTLSGGESQRIRLATQLGAALVGVLYVLDEPSVGLHANDNQRLLSAIRALVSRGNSVLLVEHDRDAILEADYVVDMGPLAGRLGGRIVAQGTPQELAQNPSSVTGAFLRHERVLSCERRETKGDEAALEIRNACLQNLRDISVRIPLGRLTAITGPSGSGKSSLIVDTLLPHALAATRAPRAQRAFSEASLPTAKLSGLEHIDRVVQVDQAPIGRTPRSNPASYTGIFPLLRDLFASLPDARTRGYQSNRFSFNVKGGRCESCKGDGVLRVEMQFLPDVYVLCETCAGKRYNRETLEVRYRGANISDVLELSVDSALELFASVPKIEQRLRMLQKLGLGYLTLGQSATTLSGGEAQRVKLATELAKPTTGNALCVLDEPTTGLHFTDIERLLQALVELRDAGNTIVVIEHNLELVACCDWVVDLGPEGGSGGGQLVTVGTPAQVALHPTSHTARFLAHVLAWTKR